MNNHDPQILLEAVIDNAFSRKGKKGAQDADKLKNWFENYYDGTSDSGILTTPLFKLFQEPGSFTWRLEAGLRSFPNNKAALADRLSILLEFLMKNYEFSIDMDFLNRYKYSSREERLLEILKYLHTGNKSRADIAETFGISERVLSEDLGILQNGLEFLGYSMKIEQMNRGSNTYSSLIHPLFLALRTDEIFSLTVGLKLLSRGTIFEDSLGGIADSIYKQLSSFAQEVVDRHSEPNGISYTDSEMHFVSSIQSLKKESRKSLPYYLKEPILCKVSYEEEGVINNVVGTLHLCKEGQNRWQKVLVQNQEEAIEINIDNIIGIKKIEG